MAAENDNIVVDLVISEPPAGWGGLCGLLDASTIIDLTGSVEGKTFFICGPNQMYPFCGEALIDVAVPRRLIRREVYGPLRDIAGENRLAGRGPRP